LSYWGDPKNYTIPGMPYNTLHGAYAAGLLERISLESFKFNLRGWKEPAAGFFVPSPARKQVLSERSYWLSQHAERHLVYLPSAADLVRESVDLAHTLDPPQPAASAALTDR
jgi:hypothetical protein